MAHIGKSSLVAPTLLVALSLHYFAAIAASTKCRCLPSQSCWPSPQVWQAFNASVDGGLLDNKPVASPCHDPFYDEEACNLIKQKWSDSFWRSAQPAALQAPCSEMLGIQGCSPTSNRSDTCFQGAVPVYAVKVTKAADVQSTVKFATKYNLRLVIKNTGHEFTGKNTAAGALSLWMHNLQDISFINDFVPSGCRRNWFGWQPRYSAVKVGAGVQWKTLYKAAHDNGRTVVGAQCTSVGAGGGFAQGGGHSQMSPTFGLAADNVLEFQVVKADGTLVIANSCQNQDLFWALRGGGGGTFGVVLSTTYITFPALKNLVFASYSFSAPTPSAFNNLLGRFIQLNPYLSNAGWGGNFLVDTNNTFSVQYLLPNSNRDYAAWTFGPFLSYIRSQKGCTFTGGMQTYPSYYDWHLAVQCQNGLCSFPQGFNAIEASRLIPRFTAQFAPFQLAKALTTIKDRGYARVSVYLVAGGKVSIPQNNAVNPAWRRALFHVLFVGVLPTELTTESKLDTEDQLSGTNQLLRDLCPASGSYMNEADANEPNWQQSFYGSNYWALKNIKKRVDPNGLFVCKHCVGSEDWSRDLNCRL